MTGDAQLDYALALSASMAAKEGDHQNLPKISPKKCWLPQPPPSKVSKSKAKTALQMRSDKDRSQQITESVMGILSSEFDTNKLTFDTETTFELNSETLKCHRRSESSWWNVGASKENDREKFYVTELSKYASEKCRTNSNQNEFGGDFKSIEENPVTNNRKKSKDASTKIDFELGADWEKLFKSGERSDVTIFVRDEKVLKAHSLVLFVRCKAIMNDLVEENDSKQMISWPNVSKEVARSFLRYLYSGILELELETPEDFKDAEYLSQTYPTLKPWVEFVQSIKRPDFGGFIEEVEENAGDVANENEKPILSATQNLSRLLGLLEDDDDDEAVEDDDDKKDESEDDEEWDMMCEYLTQKSPGNKKIKEDEDESESENENEIDDTEEAFKSSKRKSSLDLTLVNLSKKSKVDELDEDFIFDEPDASVYSRRLSPPSINLTGQFQSRLTFHYIFV